MKAIKYFLLAAAAVAAVSCAKEIAPVENETPTPEVELVPMTFTASYDAGEDAETKVAYEGGATVWKVGDKIMVIAATGTATEFEATEVTNNGKSATFEGLTENANEYYAVYPASAYKGTPEYVTDANGGKLVVEVPAVQEAVAGTFHESAILCIANTKGNTFQFKHSCAFLKFNLANPEGVKTVRLAVNGSDNVAGIGYVGVNATDMNPKYASSDSKMSKFDMITLNAPEGGFVAGENYYIAMRANSCPNGITAYIEYEDKVMSRTSTNQVFKPVKDGEGNVIMSGSIGKIKNLGQLDKNLSDVTPYDSYQLGFDLVVGDKVYNKAVNGDAVKVTADEKSMWTAFNKGGIRFLDPAVGAIVLDSHVAVSADAVLVGNVNSGKVLVNMNGKNVNHTAKTVALKNLELDTAENTNYVFANNNATADADAFILDNCSVTGLIKPLWYVNVAGYTLKDLTLVNTDIALAAATNIIDLAKTTSLGNESVTIKNCILYGASNYVSRIVNNAQNLTSWPADVVFNNNTVYNLHAGTNNGLLHMAGAKSVEFKNNLVDFYSLYTTEYVIRIWKNTPTYTVDNNHFWARAASGIPQDLTFYSNVKVEAAAANITSGAYPFTSTVPGAGATR